MMKISGMFSRFMMVAFLLLSGLSAYAQNSFSVKVKLVDEGTGEPVGFATVSLTLAGEDEAAKYVLTDSEGKADIAKVKKGSYVLKAEIMGYKTISQEVVVDKNVDLGTVKMSEDVEQLDAKNVIKTGYESVFKILDLENQLLADIRKIDINREFYYNAPVEDHLAIELSESDKSLNTLMNPATNYDINNVNNSFVISKLDIDYLDSGIKIARSSKLN